MTALQCKTKETLAVNRQRVFEPFGCALLAIAAGRAHSAMEQVMERMLDGEHDRAEEQAHAHGDGHLDAVEDGTSEVGDQGEMRGVHCAEILPVSAITPPGQRSSFAPAQSGRFRRRLI